MTDVNLLMENIVLGECPRWHDGRLWFSTVKGVASVDPALLFPNTNLPAVQIQAIRLGRKLQNSDGLRAPMPDHITVPPGTGSLEIDFAMLNPN